MSIEAMKQAFEVLEKASDAGYSIECEAAITSLRQAIASAESTLEAEQEFVCSTGLCRYRKPLTSEQIGQVLSDANVTELPNGYEMVDLEIARAIEAAHGIKGEA